MSSDTPPIRPEHLAAMFTEAPRDWWQYVPCGVCWAKRQEPCSTRRTHVSRYRAGLLLHGTLWLLAEFPADVLGAAAASKPLPDGTGGV